MGRNRCPDRGVHPWADAERTRFDAPAAVPSETFRVICVDLPGRGHSDWLNDPMLYQVQHCVTASGHLLAWIGRDVAWVGNSLGGSAG